MLAASRLGRFCLRIRKHPANELTGYPYHVPSGTINAVGTIMVASRFNGWVGRRRPKPASLA